MATIKFHDQHQRWYFGTIAAGGAISIRKPDGEYLNGAMEGSDTFRLYDSHNRNYYGRIKDRTRVEIYDEQNEWYYGDIEP